MTAAAAPPGPRAGVDARHRAAVLGVAAEVAVGVLARLVRRVADPFERLVGDPPPTIDVRLDEHRASRRAADRDRPAGRRSRRPPR